MWVCSLFGHADVRLLDGGRQRWIAEGRPLVTDVPSPAPAAYPVVPRDDVTIRAFKDDVLAHIGHGKLVDVRSPGEFSGELTHMADYPQEGALRAGHIPTAQNVPWRRAANDDGTFRPVDQLAAIYLDELGISAGDDVIAYCRIGERSTIAWFVLTHLLGLPNSATTTARGWSGQRRARARSSGRAGQVAVSPELRRSSRIFGCPEADAVADAARLRQRSARAAHALRRGHRHP